MPRLRDMLTDDERRRFDRSVTRNTAAHREWVESEGRRGWPAWHWLDEAWAKRVRARQTTDTRASE